MSTQYRAFSSGLQTGDSPRRAEAARTQSTWTAGGFRIVRVIVIDNGNDAKGLAAIFDQVLVPQKFSLDNIQEIDYNKS
jgi:hypothetical protein